MANPSAPVNPDDRPALYLQPGGAMRVCAKQIVVDDDQDYGRMMAMILAKLGIDCVVASSGQQFLELVGHETELVFLDLNLPDIDGVALLRVLAARNVKAKIILFSGAGSSVLESALGLAEELGLNALGKLDKPFKQDCLKKLLKQPAEKTRQNAHSSESRAILTDDEIARSVLEDQFEMHYQPQIDLSTGNLIGIEGLVRWQHPNGRLYHPGDFLERLTSLGLIDQLGWLVAKHGLADLSQVAEHRGSFPSLSINFPPASLLDLEFPDHLKELASQYDVPLSRVVIEVTESGLIENLSRSLDVLSRLRLKGAHLSVDDFGTGYSTMAQLRHIPADEVKIDRSFIANYEHRDADQVLVRRMIDIAHDLKMRAVAEGVETQRQLDLIREIGCDVGQGFFICRPLPLNQLRHRLLEPFPKCVSFQSPSEFNTKAEDSLPETYDLTTFLLPEPNSTLKGKLCDELYDGVYFVDPGRKITYWNRGAESLTGFLSRDVVGVHCFNNLLSHVDEAGSSLCANGCPLSATLQDGNRRECCAYLRHKDGHRVAVRMRVSPIRSDDGEIIGAVEIFSDNSAQKALERRSRDLEVLAFRDLLTGLSNRRHMDLLLEQTMEEVKRFGRSAGILMLDIDHFKAVNDRFGHNVGDLVLKTVADTIRYAFRAEDAVGRWGGEEFLIITKDLDLAALERRAERCRSLIETSLIRSGQESIRVTASIGGTLVNSGEPVTSAIELADSLMYQSKSRGRNCTTISANEPYTSGRG